MPQHNIEPVYNERSKVLILGSFPSVRSREAQFFYGHKQNRFWKVLSAVLECPVPEDVPQKKAMLLDHGVALWDVIATCEIRGSSDASIRNVVPNDLSKILEAAKIRSIYANGAKSYELYQRYLYPVTKREICKLPSTSPANAAYDLEHLVSEWKKIRQFLY